MEIPGVPTCPVPQKQQDWLLAPFLKLPQSPKVLYKVTPLSPALIQEVPRVLGRFTWSIRFSDST